MVDVLDHQMKFCLPLIKIILIPLEKIVLLLLGLTAAASVVDAGVHKKILGSGIFGSRTTILIISKKEMRDIRKKGKSSEDPALLVKGLLRQLKEKNKQRGGFIRTLLGTLCAKVFEN